MPWDHKYRRLNEGEVIKETDECLADSHLGWSTDGGQCAGKLAPSPNYTSHRVYRRKRDCPLCGLVLHFFKRFYAKVVFKVTKLKSKYGLYSDTQHK